MHGLRSIERMGDEALVRTHISNIVDMAGIQYWYQIDGESSLHHANIIQNESHNSTVNEWEAHVACHALLLFVRIIWQWSSIENTHAQTLFDVP